MSKKKGDNLMAKLARDLNSYFTKENIQMANACERCPDSLIIRKMQIKPQ